MHYLLYCIIILGIVVQCRAIFDSAKCQRFTKSLYNIVRGHWSTGLLCAQPIRRANIKYDFTFLVCKLNRVCVSALGREWGGNRAYRVNIGKKIARIAKRCPENITSDVKCVKLLFPKVRRKKRKTYCFQRLCYFSHYCTYCLCCHYYNFFIIIFIIIIIFLNYLSTF